MADNAPLNSCNLPGAEILEQGLNLLCQNDPDAHQLVVLRFNEIITLLCRYIAEIESYNPVYKLVGTNDRQELIHRHILDSLVPLGLFFRLLKNRSPEKIPHIADVGSGAGLPGIPLAIAMPQINFTLIERMTKRVNFLQNTIETLELCNVTVVKDELEKYAHGLVVKNLREQTSFDLVTFRAFRSFEPKIIKGLFRLCADTGVIAAYKGRRDKIQDDILMLEKNTGSTDKSGAGGNSGFAGKSKFHRPVHEVIPCPTPLLAEERHILLIYRSS